MSLSWSVQGMQVCIQALHDGFFFFFFEDKQKNKKVDFLTFFFGKLCAAPYAFIAKVSARIIFHLLLYFTASHILRSIYIFHLLLYFSASHLLRSIINITIISLIKLIFLISSLSLHAQLGGEA